MDEIAVHRQLIITFYQFLLYWCDFNDNWQYSTIWEIIIVWENSTFFSSPRNYEGLRLGETRGSVLHPVTLRDAVAL
jgi:hypothetical protein